MPEYKTIVFHEVIRSVYDPEWDRYDMVLMWVTDPMFMDIKTGETKERLVVR